LSLELFKLLAGNVSDQQVKWDSVNVQTKVNRLDLGVWARESVTDIEEAEFARR
jgi:hypothetical protein